MRDSGLCAILLLVMPIVVAQSNTPVWRNGAQEKKCGLGTYHDLELAFRNATMGAGETLVTVQVLPCRKRGYALALKRVGREVKLLRAVFDKQLWTQLGPPLTDDKTRQRCLDLAVAARVDTEELPARADTTAQIWAAFSNLNLETDTCPRHGKQCATLYDGTYYIVRTNDGRSLRITEIGNSKRIKSENAALLDWVRSLIQMSKSSVTVI